METCLPYARRLPNAEITRHWLYGAVNCMGSQLAVKLFVIFPETYVVFSLVCTLHSYWRNAPVCREANCRLLTLHLLFKVVFMCMNTTAAIQLQDTLTMSQAMLVLIS